MALPALSRDELGRETKRILPGGAFETKDYDDAGNLTTRVDFRGRTILHGHDPNNSRLTSITYPTGPATGFTYTPTGRRLTATDARGTTGYVHDLRDRLERITYPDGRRLDYGYDPASNRTSLSATIGTSTLTTGYGYDDDGRLETVTDPQARVYTHGYDPVHNRSSLAYPNGTTTSYTYNTLNRLTNLTTANPVVGIVQGYTFTLGLSGNRTRIDEADGSARVYTYDDVYRLLTDNVTGAVVYDKTLTYDNVGNRLTQITNGQGAGSVSYIYDDRDRLITEAGASLTYDNNGNLTGKVADGTTYTWDYENRLIGVTKVDGTIVAHVYDVDGVRVQTTTTLPGQPAVAVNYLVDTSGSLSHVVAETDVVGGVLAYYVRGDDLLSVIRGGPNGTRFMHADGIGSIRRLTDEGGAVTDSYTYTAFGEPLAHTGTDPQPYAFAGEPYDPNSGFQYHRARWMDAGSGRFVGMDPFAGSSYEPISLHRYLYANADPVGHVDPTGEFTLSESAVVSGIISSLSAGTVNAMMTAVLNGVAGQDTSATDLRDAFLVGAITAPVGGALARAFAPLLRASLEPFLIAVGSLRRVTLVGTTSGWERFLVKFSRIFFNTNVKYPSVTATPLGQALKRYVPSMQWEQHHIFIQQAWSRAGSSQQLYSNVLANEGLRRIGNGLWNLIPIPASMNGWLGRSPMVTQMIASIYYAVMVFGPAQVAVQAAELDSEE